MVVLQNSSGQLGNRLLISSHVIAYCLANNESLINFGFSDYIKYFSLTNFLKNKIFIARVTQNQKVLFYFTNMAKKFINYVYHKNYVYYKAGWVHTEIGFLIQERKSIIFLEGEGFRSSVDLQNHKELIKALFTPKLNYQKKIEAIYRKVKRGNLILCGIHLRKGDYTNWKDGKYYYEDNTYLTFIQQVENLFKDQSIKFILCSDIEINIKSFAKTNAYISDNEMIVDLYLLAKCDYLLGPPSTFTGWASFYGNVPLYVIEDKNSKIKKEDFREHTL